MDGPKILVVEDDWNAAEGTQTILERSGFKVCAIAASGEEAVVQARNTAPDLALVDIVLSGNMDGIATARQLHLDQSIPVIYLTAYSEDTFLERAKDTEPFAYLLKPYKEKELLAAVKIALYQHVTSRSKVKEASRESEIRFRTIFDRSAVGISLLNRKGQVVSSNQALQGILGYSEDELMGMSYKTFSHPDDFEEDARFFKKMMGGKIEFYKLDKRYRCKDGRVVWARLISSLIRDVDGKPGYALRMLEDITQQKLAEEAVNASEERYRQLVELSPDGILVNREDRIEFVNPAGVRMLGATGPDELVGKSFYDIFPVEARARIRQRTAALLKEGRPILNANEEVLRLDGARVLAELSAAPFTDRSGRAIRYILRDVTQRSQAEEQVRRHVQRTELLARYSKALAESNQDNHLLAEIVARSVSETIGDAGLVILISDDPQALSLASVFHPSPQVADSIRTVWSSRPARVGEGVTGWVARSGEAVLMPVLGEEEVSPLLRSEIELFRELDVYSLLVVPLRAQGRLLGSLAIARGAPGQSYTEEDRDFLQELADRAALAMANAQLIDETSRRLKNVQALRTIDTAITSSLDLNLTLSVILDQVMTQQQVDAADVLLLNPHTHQLEYTAGRGFHTTVPPHTHLRLGEGFVGRAAVERQTVYIPDLASAAKDFSRTEQLASEGFVTYCGVPLIAKGVVKGVLEVFQRFPFRASGEWLAFLETLAGQAAIAVDSAQLFTGLQRTNIELVLAYDATIEGWSKALDLRDKNTEGHSKRVTEMTVQLGVEMGLGDTDLVHLRRGALLHDIGKIAVPDQILNKDGPLNDEEWKLMKKHPQYAYEMLAPISYLQPAIDIPYCHHEHWDGSGYPRGLKEEQIPLSARIFAVVDTWDALTSDRPYRLAWPQNQTEDHLRSLAGIHFDPKVVEVFLRNHP